MKRSILFSKYLVATVFAALIFQTSCKREVGYYETSSIVNATSLDTYAYLKSKPGVYDSLLLLIDKFGIEKTLRDSSVTLFAPSNQSFQIAIKNLNDVRKAQGKNPIYLSELAFGGKNYLPGKIKDKAVADSAQVDTMTSRYIIRKLYVADDFTVGDGQFINSVRGGYPMHGQRVFADAEGYQNGGSEVIEFANTKRSLFVTKWSKTTTSSVNIKTKNGIVHLLRPDHVFGFDEFVSRLTLVPPPPSVFDLKKDKFYPLWPGDGAEYDGRVSSGETFKKALDGSVLTKFICNWKTSSLTYMYWIPSEARVANAYTMTSANDSKLYKDRDPRAFRLEGTLDPNPTPSSVWVTLDTRQDQDWTTNYQQKIFDFNNTVAYTGYRLIILQIGPTTTSGLFQISEWTMNYRK